MGGREGNLQYLFLLCSLFYKLELGPSTISNGKKRIIVPRIMRRRRLFCGYFYSLSGSYKVLSSGVRRLVSHRDIFISVTAQPCFVLNATIKQDIQIATFAPSALPNTHIFNIILLVSVVLAMPLVLQVLLLYLIILECRARSSLKPAQHFLETV